MRTVLLSAAAWHEGASAPNAGFFLRTGHAFFPKQFRPDDPVQIPVERQDAFQKVIAVNSAVVDRRIPGIDDRAVRLKDAFPIDTIAALETPAGIFFEERTFALFRQKKSTGAFASAVREIDLDHGTHILESMKIAPSVLNEATIMDHYR